MNASKRADASHAVARSVENAFPVKRLKDTTTKEDGTYGRRCFGGGTV